MAEAVMRKQSAKSLERQSIVSFPFEEAARRIMPFEDDALLWDPTVGFGAPVLSPGYVFSADATFVVEGPVAAPNLKDQIKSNNVSVSRERPSETLLTESQVSGADVNETFHIPTITVGDVPAQAAGSSDSKKNSGKRAGVKKALKAPFGSTQKSATRKEERSSKKSQIPGVRKWKLTSSSNTSLVLKRRHYTDEERDEIGKNRGNVCEFHRRRKQKCPPTGCPDNKLYDANRSSVSLALTSNIAQKDSTGDSTATYGDCYGKSPGIPTTISEPESAAFFSSRLESTCPSKSSPAGNSVEDYWMSSSLRQYAPSQQTSVAGNGFDEAHLYPTSHNNPLAGFDPISELDIQAFVDSQGGEPSGGNPSGMQGEIPDGLYGMPREAVYMDDGIQKAGMMMSYDTRSGLAADYFDMSQEADAWGVEARIWPAPPLQSLFSPAMLQSDYSGSYTASSSWGPSPRPDTQNETSRGLSLGSPEHHTSLRASTKRVLSKIIDKASTWSEKRRAVHAPRVPVELGQAESSGTPSSVGARQPTAAAAPAPKPAEESSDVLILSRAFERTGLSEREAGQ